jgi:hypothetical protein
LLFQLLVTIPSMLFCVTHFCTMSSSFDFLTFGKIANVLAKSLSVRLWLFSENKFIQWMYDHVGLNIFYLLRSFPLQLHVPHVLLITHMIWSRSFLHVVSLMYSWNTFKRLPIIIYTPSISFLLFPFNCFDKFWRITYNMCMPFTGFELRHQPRDSDGALEPYPLLNPLTDKYGS